MRYAPLPIYVCVVGIVLDKITTERDRAGEQKAEVAGNLVIHVLFESRKQDRRSNENLFKIAKINRSKVNIIGEVRIDSCLVSRGAARTELARPSKSRLSYL
jgi:hypothetical protein